MRSLFKFPLLFLILAAFTSSSSPAGESLDSPVTIDLAKTRELFRSWTLRKSFPDSITLAYYYAYSLKALEGGVKPDFRNRMVAFVKSCQREDGGFVSDPKYGSRSNIIYTYYALAALHLLGADGAIDRNRASGFVRSLIQQDGSIRPTPEGKGSPSLASTFYGVQSLQLLQKLDVLDREKTVAFVLAHRTADDGFGVTTKGATSPRAVSMAVRTLATLGRLNDEIRGGATRYLENAIALMGIKGPKFRALSSMQAAADIVAALARMGVLQDVITDQLLDFVTALYIPQNGGFGPAPGLGTTPPSTYQGIYCLAKLGGLEAP